MARPKNPLLLWCHGEGPARVAPALKQVERELVLCVDDPDEQEPLRLQAGYGQVQDVTVSQLAVSQRHTCACHGEQAPLLGGDK